MDCLFALQIDANDNGTIWSDQQSSKFRDPRQGVGKLWNGCRAIKIATKIPGPNTSSFPFGLIWSNA